jgi:hypothetical protein
VAGATGDAARIALDKSRQFEIAASAGLRVPATADLQTLAAVPAALPASFGAGPWIVKPALAVTVQGGRLVKGRSLTASSLAELADAARTADIPMLVQPVLRGIGEGVFGFATASSGVAAWSGHRRIRMMNPAGSGSSACTSIDPDPELLGPITRFLAAARWRGLFMMEFLRDAEGTAWLMELNGRPWGSMALARYRNLAYPVWAVRAAKDTDFAPEPVPSVPHIVARHAGRELAHLAFVARGSRRGDPEWPGLLRSMRSVLSWRRGERFYNLRRGGLTVFAADTCATVAGVARAARGGSR